MRFLDQKGLILVWQKLKTLLSEHSDNGDRHLPAGGSGELLYLNAEGHPDWGRLLFVYPKAGEAKVHEAVLGGFLKIG